MEKGKLCKDDERDKSGMCSGFSDNNIFDEDFMRSDEGTNGSSQEKEEDQSEQDILKKINNSLSSN